MCNKFLLFSLMSLTTISLFSNNCCPKPCTPLAIQPVSISCPTVTCNSNVVHISQADVNPNGYFITTPGRYCLIEDITFAPFTRTPTPLAAITILSSNVELDLNGYVLTGPGNVSDVVGVKVANASSTLVNVIIINGSIQNFTLGIYIDPVNGLLLQDIAAVFNGVNGSITNNGIPFVGGIAITDGSSNVTMRRVTASNSVGVAGTISTFGAFLFNVNLAVIEDCQFNNNTSINYSSIGLYLAQANNISVTNCTADGNTGATQAVGFEINETLATGNLIFNHCFARQNTLNGVPLPPVTQNVVFADGFYLIGANQCTFIDCSAIGQSSDLPIGLLAQNANGFEMESSLDCQFERCIAIDNGFATTITNACGFHIAGNRCTFNDCYAETNYGPLGFSYGFNVENFTNFGTPIGNEVIPSEDAIINCKIYGYPLSANTYGIRLYNALTCVVDGCLLQSNAPDGILLAESAICLNQGNVIKHNQIINITIQETIQRPDAVRGTWAIEDLTNPLHGPYNYYADNYAYDYPGISGVVNYNAGVRLAGASSVSYIEPWTIPGAVPLPSSVSKLTNLDIRYLTCAG